MSDIEILILTSQIGQALGVAEESTLEQLPGIARRIKRNSDRYEKLVTMTPTEFAALHGRALREMRSLSELVDAWPEKSPLSSDKQ